MGRRGWRGFKYHANEKEAGNHQGPLGMEEEGIDSQNSQRCVVTEDEQEEEEEKKKKKKKKKKMMMMMMMMMKQEFR